MKSLMEETDKWLRHRIRAVYLETIEKGTHEISDI